MVAYNFQPQFVGAIQRGEKRQTVRRLSQKVHAGPGDTINLYTGQRTKQCRLIGTALVTGTQAILVHEDGIRLSGTPLTPEEAEHFARSDGFDSLAGFLDFIRGRYELPFRGLVIKWELKGREREEGPPSDHLGDAMAYALMGKKAARP